MAVGVIARAVPRIIKAQGLVALPTTPANGILAGDTQSNWFAKNVLYYVLDKVHEEHPRSGPFSYVGDLAQSARGKDLIVVGDRLGNAGTDLYEELTNIGCSI